MQLIDPLAVHAGKRIDSDIAYAHHPMCCPHQYCQQLFAVYQSFTRTQQHRPRPCYQWGIYIYRGIKIAIRNVMVIKTQMVETQMEKTNVFRTTGSHTTFFVFRVNVSQISPPDSHHLNRSTNYRRLNGIHLQAILL